MNSEKTCLSNYVQSGEPAFSVHGGIIQDVNPAAEKLNLIRGIPITSLLWKCHDEYSAFQDGKLFLNIQVLGNKYRACVTKTQDTEIFAIDYGENARCAPSTELDYITSFYTPVQSALAEIDFLIDNEYVIQKESGVKSLLRAKQLLFQLLHELQDIRDIKFLGDASPSRMEYANITACINTCFNKINTLQGLSSRFSINTTDEEIICYFDPEYLKRGLLILIASAVKFSDHDKIISLDLTHTGSRVSVTVKNRFQFSPSKSKSNFLIDLPNDPRLASYDAGIGSGLMIVRAIAFYLGGTLQMRIRQLRKTGNDDEIACEAIFTLTVPKGKPGSQLLASPLAFDPGDCEGFDCYLVSLSDVLPPDAFR